MYHKPDRFFGTIANFSQYCCIANVEIANVEFAVDLIPGQHEDSPAVCYLVIGDPGWAATVAVIIEAWASGEEVEVVLKCDSTSLHHHIVESACFINPAKTRRKVPMPCAHKTKEDCKPK